MKHSLVRRKKISQGLNVEPPPVTPTSHPGYAPDAALHAIKRHALEFVNPKELQVSAKFHKTFESARDTQKADFGRKLTKTTKFETKISRLL